MNIDGVVDGDLERRRRERTVMSRDHLSNLGLTEKVLSGAVIGAVTAMGPRGWKSALPRCTYRTYQAGTYLGRGVSLSNRVRGPCWRALFDAMHESTWAEQLCHVHTR